MGAITTATLLALVHKNKPFEAFFLNMFFPHVVTFPTEEIKFDELSEELDLAPMVSPRVAGKVQHEKGGVQRTLKPPYVKPKHIVDPSRLLKRNAGERLGGELSPVERRQAIVVDLLGLQDRQITRREEWLAVQIILTGAVNLNVQGMGPVQLDFGRSAANNVQLAGAARWSQLDKATSRQPLEDLENASSLCSGSGDVCIMDQATWDSLASFQCVKDLLDSRRGSKSVVEMGPSTKKVVSYKGEIGDLHIYVHKGVYKDDDGSTKKLMPANTFVVGSSSHEGIRAYGAIRDAKANANGVVEAERYPKNWFTEDPSDEYLMTQSAPLPCTPDGDAFAVYTVE